MQKFFLYIFIALSISLTSCDHVTFPDPDNEEETDNKGDNGTDNDDGSNDGDNNGDNNGNGGDNGGSNGDSDGISTGDIVSVGTFINEEINCGVYVRGYIVGDCKQTIKNACFIPPFTQPQNILLADSPNEDDRDKVMVVSLASGSNIRASLNLQDNPKNFGRRVLIFGYKENCLGSTCYGIKKPTGFQFDD